MESPFLSPVGNANHPDTRMLAGTCPPTLHWNRLLLQRRRTPIAGAQQNGEEWAEKFHQRQQISVEEVTHGDQSFARSRTTLMPPIFATFAGTLGCRSGRLMRCAAGPAVHMPQISFSDDERRLRARRAALPAAHLDLRALRARSRQAAQLRSLAVLRYPQQSGRSRPALG